MMSRSNGLWQQVSTEMSVEAGKLEHSNQSNVIAKNSPAVHLVVATMTSVGDQDANFAVCQRLAEVSLPL